MWCERTWDKSIIGLGKKKDNNILPFTSDGIVNGKRKSYAEAVENSSENRKMSKEVSGEKRAGIVRDSTKIHKNDARSSYSPVMGSTKSVTWKGELEVCGSQVADKIGGDEN